MRTRLKPLIDRLFDPYAETPSLEPGFTLAFRAHYTVGQLHRFFGIPGPTWSTEPLASLLAAAEKGQPARMGPFLVTPGDEPDFVTLTYAPELPAQEDEDAPRPASPDFVSEGTNAEDRNTG